MVERKIPEWRLGRHVQHDSRSWNFQATGAPLKPTEHRAFGLPLDQGNVGSCTANALCGALNCEPNFGGKPYGETNAIQLYVRETTDEGEPYPQFDPGGSGLAVCKAAKELGLISSYQHCFNLNQALAALVVRPIIVGVNWYSGFDKPLRTGEAKISGNVRGGHELVLTELHPVTQFVGGYNSWGPDWGPIGGKFYWSFQTFERLLSEQGDATVPIR